MDICLNSIYLLCYTTIYYPVISLYLMLRNNEVDVDVVVDEGYESYVEDETFIDIDGVSKYTDLFDKLE